MGSHPHVTCYVKNRLKVPFFFFVQTSRLINKEQVYLSRWTHVSSLKVWMKYYLKSNVIHKYCIMTPKVIYHPTNSKVLFDSHLEVEICKDNLRELNQKPLFFSNDLIIFNKYVLFEKKLSSLVFCNMCLDIRCMGNTLRRGSIC